MLVLSRRPNQRILFPSIGVTVEVLQIKGNTVRVGVEAPPEVEVLREELARGRDVSQPAPLSAHAVKNRLNKIGLHLQLFQRQLEAGQRASAEATLESVFTYLEALDREYAETSRPAARPRLRTLLVEDDSNERQLLADLLSMGGCEVQTVADGQDALDYLSSHDRPDVILLDMWMPRCDGPQTVETIRRDPRYHGLKVFAVTGASPDDVGVPTGPGGVDAWFPKPLDARKLLEAIRANVAPQSGTA